MFEAEPTDEAVAMAALAGREPVDEDEWAREDGRRRCGSPVRPRSGGSTWPES